MKAIIICILTSFLLFGCATKYQSKGFTGGFSETQLDENVFNVSFAGNAYTSRERVTDFTLLRCAELTLDNGYKYFAIVDANSYSSNSAFTTGNYSDTTYNSQTHIISKPSSSNTIVLFYEKPKNVFSYNAEFIFKNISQKYDIN